MGAQSNITIDSIVYTPAGRDTNLVARWINKALSVAFPRLFSLRVPSPDKNGLTKVTVNGSYPLIIPEDSECGCAGQLKAVARFRWEFELPAALFSTAGEAQNHLDFVNGVIDSAPVQAALLSLEPSW